MVYIPKGSTFSPGRILGDAKTLETRGVPYRVNDEGKADPKIELGDVVYLDEDGFAVPFARGNTTGKHIPYGVVGNMTHVNLDGPQSSAPANTVRIVTEGVVAVEYWPTSPLPPWVQPSNLPRKGDPVNQFGCKAEGLEPDECVIGICEGVGTDPKDTNTDVVAVRLTTGAAASVAYTPTLYQLVKNIQQGQTARNRNDDDDGTIPAYAPVRIIPSTDEDGLPLIKQWTSEAQQLYGYAAEPIAPGETGYVVIKGPIDLPYVNPDTVKDKKALARGHRVVWVSRDGIDWDKIFTFIKSAASVVGAIVDVGTKAANCKQAWNSAGFLSKDKAGKKAILGKTTANGVEEEPVIDGWFTVDVDPQFVHAPMSLDYAVAEDESTTLIPGHVYGGSDSGVKEYQTNWDGYPFAGVCTGLPNEEGKTPILREGAVDVIAADDWAAGDYIDYTRHSIPEAYEPYVPHIGVAAADTAEGELGAVHLQPWDPNEYVVLDHVTLVEDDDGNLPLNTSVYQWGHEIRGCPMHPVEPVSDGNYYSIRGILRTGIKNYITDPEEEYPDRAIVQTGGYVRLQPGSVDPPLNWYTVGSPVRALGETWVDAIYPQAIGPDMGFMQLGMVVSTFSATESSEGVIIVKLDIRHHPQMVVEVTGREDVRFNIKKVIPLIKTTDNKMAFANESDQYFTIEGLTEAVYNDSNWRGYFINNYNIAPTNPTADNLKHEDSPYAILATVALLPDNQAKITINTDLPDQWADPLSHVVGYRIALKSSVDEDDVIVSAPVYFIMNSENARKPIEPTETRESDEQNWFVKNEFKPPEVTPENVRSEAVDGVAAPAAAQPTPSVDEVIDEVLDKVLGPADDADAAPAPEIKTDKKLRKKVKED